MKNAIKIIAFCLIFIGLMQVFFCVFHAKMATAVDSLYTLEKDTVDVLAVGSSHAYRSINPAIWYENEGYSAYVIGSPGQTVWHSYYYIKEVLKKQHPKLIIFDCYKVTLEEGYFDESQSIKAFGSLWNSPNRWAGIMADLPEDYSDKIEFYLGFPQYHSRYKKLKKKDFVSDYSRLSSCFLGYKPYLEPDENEFYDEAVMNVSEMVPMSDKIVEYLDKIVSLCRENNIGLLFVNAPSSYNEVKYQPYYNSLKFYAYQQGIPFINGTLLFDELGLDNATDWAVEGHLTHTGAAKWTKYLEDYIRTNYTFTDHRGDAKYRRWEDNAEYFAQITQVTYSKDENEEGFE